MKASVYLETTIVSYLAAATSRDIVVAAHQQLTREWWERRDRFDLYVSQAVIEEATRGDVSIARRRNTLLQGVPVLSLDDRVQLVAAALIKGHAVPQKALIDAVHIAVAAVNRIDYLLTWNCTHLANAAVRGKIDGACRDAGLHPPVICTPEELMEV